MQTNSQSEVNNNETHTFSVKGDQPITFSGVLLGSGTGGNPRGDYFHRVEIFLTVGGKYVVRDVFDTPGIESVMRDAAHFENAKSVIGWLRKGGKMSAPAMDACEEASESDKAFGAAWHVVP